MSLTEQNSERLRLVDHLLLPNITSISDTKQLDIPNAIQKVFTTFELVEIILIYVCNLASRSEVREPRGQLSLHVLREEQVLPRILEVSGMKQNHCSCNEYTADTHVEELRILHRLQRVNTTFRTVISRSSILRIKTFRGVDHEELQAGQARRYVWGQSCCLPRTLNPLASSFGDLISVESASLHAFSSSDTSKPDPVLHLQNVAEESIKQPYEFASWRIMLLMNATTSFELEIRARWH